MGSKGVSPLSLVIVLLMAPFLFLVFCLWMIMGAIVFSHVIMVGTYNFIKHVLMEKCQW